jgi:hypothetical protein
MADNHRPYRHSRSRQDIRSQPSRDRAESSNKSEIMGQANHETASGQLNLQQFHPRPVLEEYWERLHGPLPYLANVETRTTLLEREKAGTSTL